MSDANRFLASPNSQRPTPNGDRSNTGVEGDPTSSVIRLLPQPFERLALGVGSWELGVVLVLILALTPAAEAQVYVGADAPRGGSIEASGGGMFAPGFDMGSMTAELTRSTPTDKFDLFTSDSEVSGFPGVFVRLGYYLSESVSVEGGMRYARPRVSVRLSDDAESAPDVTAD